MNPNLLYKVAEAWTSDDDIKKLYTGINIAKISEIMGKITKYIHRHKHYNFLKDYSENLSVHITSGTLFVSSFNDVVNILYSFYDKDADLNIKLSSDCIEKLKDFAESLTKHQDDIIKDIQKLNEGDK
jgi:hypothetical protein